MSLRDGRLIKPLALIAKDVFEQIAGLEATVVRDARDVAYGQLLSYSAWSWLVKRDAHRRGALRRWAETTSSRCFLPAGILAVWRR